MSVELTIFKDKEYYDKNKQYFNKHYNQETKEFLGPKVIGRCSYLYKKYSTNNYQTFANCYFNDTVGNNFNNVTNKGDEDKGRSVAQLTSIANKLYEKLKFDSNVTLDKCFDLLITHTIIETIDGHVAENEVIDKLLSYGKYIIVNEVNYIDSDFNVDIIVRDKSSQLVSYIQVKPISAFLSTSEGVKLDRCNFFRKQKNFNTYLKSIGRYHEIKDIDFMCYEKKDLNENKHKFLINPKTGKKTFKLNELTDTSGNVILDRNNLKFDYL